jgi:3-deoxy-manno-octulosonate cytidylyltransferase (CMP-KDO synthetase)
MWSLKNLFTKSGSMSNSLKQLKVAAIIPARFASTRFPGKPLVKLCGKPMLQWVIEGTKTSSLISTIFVATDHPEIAKLSEECGVRAIMTSEKCKTGSDRVYEALQILNKENNFFDIVINIQGDEPMINHHFIDPLVRAFISEPKLDMATLSHPLKNDDIQNLNAVKVLMNINSEAIYFSRLAIPFSRGNFSEGLFDQTVQKHIGLYGFNSQFLEKFCTTAQSQIEISESLEQLRALHLGAKIKVISVPEAVQGIDSPEDLILFEKKYFDKNNRAQNEKK